MASCKRHHLALEGQVGLDQLLHARFDRRQLFLGQRPAVDDRAVETARGQGVINGDVRGGEGVLEGGFEQEGDRTAVDARAVRIGHPDEPDAGIQLDGVSQFAQFAVDHRAHDGVVRVPFRQALEKGGDGPVARAAEDPAIGQEHLHGGSGDSRLVDTSLARLHHWPGLTRREGRLRLGSRQPVRSRPRDRQTGAQATRPPRPAVIGTNITLTLVTHTADREQVVSQGSDRQAASPAAGKPCLSPAWFSRIKGSVRCR